MAPNWQWVLFRIHTHKHKLIHMKMRGFARHYKQLPFSRHCSLEGIILYTQLLPREQLRLLPHSYLLLRWAFHHAPRSSAAFRPVKRSVREQPPDCRQRTQVLLCSRDYEGSGKPSQAESEACPNAVFPWKPDLETVASALLLLSQSALQLWTRLSDRKESWDSKGIVQNDSFIEIN